MNYSHYKTHDPQLSDEKAHVSCAFRLVKVTPVIFREEYTFVPNGNHTTRVGYNGGDIREVEISEERYQVYIKIQKQSFQRDVEENLIAAGWRAQGDGTWIRNWGRA